MPTALVTPVGVAQNLDTLAAALDAKANITAAVEDADIPIAIMGRKAVRVTGTATKDINAAVNNESRNIDRGTSTGGTFTVTVDGQTTAGQAYNVSAANLKTAIDALSSVGTTVSVTGTGTVGDPWIVTFADGEGLVVTGAGSLTGGDSTLTVSSPVANCEILDGSTVAA